MQNRSFKLPKSFRISLLVFCAIAASLIFFSFTMKSFNDDFLAQLGITKSEADKKITNSILGGFLDQQGVKNAKNIATGNRRVITNDLLVYTKKHVTSTAFIEEYVAYRESFKPKMQSIQTPDEMQQDMISQFKKSVEETEASLKNADESLKPVFEEVLKTSKQMLKEAEDPNNPQIAAYRQNYEMMLSMNQQTYESQLKDWEIKYPPNHLLFVKQRLQQFLDETNDIDFTAELKEHKNKKVFVNPVYEAKSKRWKMAYRAGKEVIEPARDFVKKWMEEIKQL